MIDKIQQKLENYRNELFNDIQEELDKRKGLEFENYEELPFLYESDDMMGSVQVVGISEKGNLIGMFEYVDQKEKEEEIGLDAFLVEQYIDILEILREYEVSLG